MTEEKTTRKDDATTLVFPKQLTCLQVNQRLLQRSSQQQQQQQHAYKNSNRKIYEQHATRLLDCSQMNKNNKQTSDTARSETVFYELSAPFSIGELGSSVLIQVHEDDSFISPSFLIEEHFGDLYMKGRGVAAADKHCFYTGHIIGENGSSVTISVCNGMVCVIMVLIGFTGIINIRSVNILFHEN